MMAAHDHPDLFPEAWAELLARRELPEAALLTAVVRGLRAHCPECADRLEALVGLVRHKARKDSGEPGRVYAAEAQGLLPAVGALPFEERRAAKALAALAALPPAERLAKVRRARKAFRSPALVEAVFEKAHAALGIDLSAAGHWLDLAHELILHLHKADFPAAVTAAFGLRLAARRANLLRVASDRPGADRLWSALYDDPRLGAVVHPAVHAELANYEASLRLDQRRYEDAVRLIERAAGLYRAAGDGPWEAKVRVKWALAEMGLGRQRAALRHLDRAEAALGAAAASGDSPLSWMIGHNRALTHCYQGRFAKAQQALAATRPLYARHRTQENARLERWLEAMIAAGLGEAERAEALHLEARTSYLRASLPLDAALVTLDLAKLYLAEGRFVTVQGLAEGTLEIFAQQEIPAEAERAMSLLAQAAATERLTAALLARLRRGLGARA